MAAQNGIDLDTASLQQYMSFQFVPEPSTLDAEVKKVEPGSQFTIRPEGDIAFKTYFKANFKPVQSDEDKLVKEVRDAIFDSVKVHMRSDVPVGSFLSGGIDSSFIVSVAKEFHPFIYSSGEMTLLIFSIPSAAAVSFATSTSLKPCCSKPTENVLRLG